MTTCAGPADIHPIFGAPFKPFKYPKMSPEDKVPDFERTQTRGCCQCERHSMPFYFEKNHEPLDKRYTPYMDDKHTMVAASIMALRDVNVTVVLELLHGNFYGEFDNELTNDFYSEVGNKSAATGPNERSHDDNIFEIFVHTPARMGFKAPSETPDEDIAAKEDYANYLPQSSNRNAFIAVVEQKDFDKLDLPFNLPIEKVRRSRSLEYTTAETYPGTYEHQVFIDRSSNIRVSDPCYHKKVKERTIYKKFKARNDEQSLLASKYAMELDMMRTGVYHCQGGESQAPTVVRNPANLTREELDEQDRIAALDKKDRSFFNGLEAVVDPEEDVKRPPMYWSRLATTTGTLISSVCPISPSSRIAARSIVTCPSRRCWRRTRAAPAAIRDNHLRRSVPVERQDVTTDRRMRVRGRATAGRDGGTDCGRGKLLQVRGAHRLAGSVPALVRGGRGHACFRSSANRFPHATSWVESAREKSAGGARTTSPSSVAPRT